MEQETTHYHRMYVNLGERKRNTKDMANVFRNRPQSDQLTRYSAPSVPLELLWSTSTTSMRIDRTGPQENLPLGFYANVCPPPLFISSALTCVCFIANKSDFIRIFFHPFLVNFTIRYLLLLTVEELTSLGERWRRRRTLYRISIYY